MLLLLISLYICVACAFQDKAVAKPQVWCPAANCSSYEDTSICDMKILLILISNPKISSDVALFLKQFESSIEMVGRTGLASTVVTLYTNIAKHIRRSGYPHTRKSIIIRKALGNILHATRFILPSDPMTRYGAPVYAMQESRSLQATVFGRLKQILPCCRYIIYGNEPGLNRYIQKNYAESHYMIPYRGFNSTVKGDLLRWLGFTDCYVREASASSLSFVIDERNETFDQVVIEGMCLSPFIL